MQSVNIEEARKTLGELVDRARIAGDHTLITRYNKPAAVLVDPDWYDKASAALGRQQGGSEQP